MTSYNWDAWVEIHIRPFAICTYYLFALVYSNSFWNLSVILPLTSIALWLEMKFSTFCWYSLRSIITAQFPLSAFVTKALFLCNLPLIWFRNLNSSISLPKAWPLYGFWWFWSFLCFWLFGVVRIPVPPGVKRWRHYPLPALIVNPVFVFMAQIVFPAFV